MANKNKEVNKTNKEELEALTESINTHNELKRKIGDTVIQQQNLLASLARLKAEFAKEENKLIEKYGEDARINMQTGEVTRVENPPIKEK